MATEVTSNSFAKPSTTNDDDLNANTNISQSNSEDVSSNPPAVNGTYDKESSRKQDANAAESNTVSTEVSVSGGSDTEATKAESAKAAADGKGHLRSDSKIKKFASFKSVSVNKTFLAAKVSGVATPSKLGEKISASTNSQAGLTTTTLRPRLVAKSGSGLRDASSKSTLGINGGKPGAPDASAVWNKNRPAPPPEPKAYTDEELQQRYGIHLATRIQKDDGGKQANWADIDDDDDDWAPDSMEWADGTKITLPQVEEPIQETPIPVASPPPREKISENISTERPRSISPAPPSTSPLPAFRSGGLGSGRTGLVLTKGPTEKPTLVAKPPGPPPAVKSPWAPLPPVEKVNNVLTDTQSHQPPQSRFGRADPHGFQGMPPPPAKEIAADDFSRTWRDGNTNNNRELFDSKSGRYEPVNDARRASRNDSRPSLLQRSHQNDGPAEPSAAFQTHRSSGEPGYGRRRTSSNVSGGSGNFIRRMSRGQDLPAAHDLTGPRRGSLAAVNDETGYPGAPLGQNLNQRGASSQAWQQSKTSPTVSDSSPQLSITQPVVMGDVQAVPVKSYEEQLEEQKKIMRASRELAIKRRQEAEAKEESEKKERLRLKLLELGPLPEKKGQKETPKDEKANPIPTQIQARTQQDGLEKPQIKPAVQPEAATVKSDEQALASKTEGNFTENRANGTHVLPLPHAPVSQKVPSDTQSPQTWQNTPANSDRLQAPWAQQQTQQASRNVWGPPTNDRSLGNGTFDPELNSVPDMASSNPGPIGPPGRGNNYQQQRGSREQVSTRPNPIGPPNRQAYRPTPDPRVAASGWANAAQIIREDERRFYEDNSRAAAIRKEQEAQGLVKSFETPAIQDTWRQVIIGEDGKRSKVVANHVTMHNDDKPLNLPNQEESIIRPGHEEKTEELNSNIHRHFDAIGTHPRQVDRSAPSRSRFFPSHDVRLEHQPTADDVPYLPFERPGSPLPPPPTMPGHPVYGDNAFPQVHLPRPAPVVKLPPAVLAPIGPPKPLSFAAAVATPVVTPVRRTLPASQDIRRQEPTGVVGWQDRINNLMGRKAASPPKGHALQVDSASKNALELPATLVTATVSLPGSLNGDLSIDDDAIVSKPAAEECFEEQEMGSLPRVKVPFTAPPAAWNPALPPKSGPRNLALHDIASVGLDSLRFFFNPYIANNSISIHIKLPGQPDVKTVSLAVPPLHSNRRNGSSRSGSKQHPVRGGRSRDGSAAATTPALPESGRGFNKERKSSNWGRSQPNHRTSSQN